MIRAEIMKPRTALSDPERTGGALLPVKSDPPGRRWYSVCPILVVASISALFAGSTAGRAAAGGLADDDDPKQEEREKSRDQEKDKGQAKDRNGDRVPERGRGRNGDERSDERGSGGDRDRSPWSWMRDTSPEQREKIRLALKQVWEDPDVQGARDRMKEATDAYKEVLREAVAKTDPDVRSIIDRILRERLWHDLTRDDTGRREPGWMRSIPEELRDRFRDVFAEIDKDPEVQALKKAFFEAPDDQKGAAWEALGAKIRSLVEAKDPELLPHLPTSSRPPPSPGERPEGPRRDDERGEGCDGQGPDESR